MCMWQCCFWPMREGDAPEQCTRSVSKSLQDSPYLKSGALMHCYKEELFYQVSES